MLDRLRQMAIFAQTVEAGSFRGAAKILRLSPSVVSHHVAQLEQGLGVALLYRSTRRLGMTRDGERLFAQARVMLEVAEEGLKAVTDHVGEPVGELRVTAPAVLGESPLMERIAAFVTQHPRVSLSLDFSDARRDMIREGFDLSIRMGFLADSQLIARKIGEYPRYVVASTGYCAGRPVPGEPNDLKDWDWLDLAPVKLAPHFHRPGRKTVILRPTARLSANDANALSRFVEAGAGVAILPGYLTDTASNEGRVQRLLPDWTVSPIGVYAVWPPNAPRGGLTGRFVDFLVGERNIPSPLP